MRGQRQGTIVQVSSMGGRVTFPLYSIYHASKWAVEGFSESLAYELRPFGVRVKLIEPGAVKTEFYHRNRQSVPPDGLEEYKKMFTSWEEVSFKAAAQGCTAEVVANAIYHASMTSSWKLRYPVGGQAPLILWIRRLLPESWFLRLIRGYYGIHGKV